MKFKSKTVMLFMAVSMVLALSGCTAKAKTISIQSDPGTMQTGEAVQLKAVVAPENASQEVKWSSDNPKVVTIDDKGQAKAVGAGKAMISVEAADGSGAMTSCQVTVQTPVSGIELDQTAVTMDPEQVLELKAAVLPKDAAAIKLKWTSSDEGVAKVDENGKVTAVTPGTATITAEAEKDAKISAACAVTVKPATVEVTSVALNKSSLSLNPKQTVSLQATVMPADATDKTLTWTSSDPKIATVDDQGKVTAVTSGTATITAASAGSMDKTSKCEVKVVAEKAVEAKAVAAKAAPAPAPAPEPAPAPAPAPAAPADIPVKSVLFKGDGGSRNATLGLKLYVNTTTNVAIEVRPANASKKSVKWSSSDKNIATVDQKGNITAVSLGTATITVKATDGSGAKATASVTVIAPNVPVTGITLTAKNINMMAGESRQLTAVVTPDTATNKGLVWSSNNTNVVKVDQNGLLTAVAEGTTSINVTAADKSGMFATCMVAVSNQSVTTVPVTGVSFSEQTRTIKPGESFIVQAVVAPANATNQDVTWTSSDPNTVSVTSEPSVKSGAKVVAVGQSGEAVITVTTVDGSFSASFTVKIKSNIPVTGVAFAKKTVIMNPGDSVTVQANVMPANATNQKLIWRSSNPNEVSVTPGQDGSATISVSAYAPVGPIGYITVTTEDGNFSDRLDVMTP